ncbi:MAG TPA: beta/gamma crystallin-related protein [Casimicrobium sp.]|jgi:uncharacterized protein YcfJ|nr:beta/gamma crystallin-related protein [Casimicrobium sp.]HPT56469.1 beta/gamma crystallin-related protein [Casimicrobium sp.]
MKTLLKTVLAASVIAVTAQASAQVTFYENDGFSGRNFTATRATRNLVNVGFNDRASSVVVLNERWEVCEDAQFSGRCVVLRPGRYPSLSAMGLNDRVSSVRAVSRNSRIDDNRYAPVATPIYDNHRRGNERLYEATVTSVRAVMGASEQRCWIEREQVGQDRNLPGAIIGGILGGVLGHQVGGGRGQDIATVGGAVAGAAIGSNAARDERGGYSQNVQRCADTGNRGQPNYWDVSYNFRGVEHNMQMVSPPGRTVTVNARGEPRS